MFPVLKYPASSQSAKPKKNTTAVEIRILWAVSSDMAHLVQALFTPIQNLMPPRQSSLLAAVFLRIWVHFLPSSQKAQGTRSPLPRGICQETLSYCTIQPDLRSTLLKLSYGDHGRKKNEAKGYTDGCCTQGDRAL